MSFAAGWVFPLNYFTFSNRCFSDSYISPTACKCKAFHNRHQYLCLLSYLHDFRFSDNLFHLCYCFKRHVAKPLSICICLCMCMLQHCLGSNLHYLPSHKHEKGGPWSAFPVPSKESREIKD